LIIFGLRFLGCAPTFAEALRRQSFGASATSIFAILLRQGYEGTSYDGQVGGQAGQARISLWDTIGGGASIKNLPFQMIKD